MFDIFNTKTVKIRASELALALEKELPPSKLRDTQKVQSVNKISSTLESIYAKAAIHNQEYKWGFLKRSIFANTFRWKLEELGYAKDFISIATEGMIVEMSGIKKSQNPKA